MKKAFTLVELIIVIGIIGILAGVLLSSFSGGTESARAAKCLNNMRNLAQAVNNAAVNNKWGHMPPAGTWVEMHGSEESRRYSQHRGWISWLSMNNEYGGGGHEEPTSFVKVSNASAYCDDLEKATFAITNGALWQASGRSLEAYVCPAHQRAVQKRHAQVRWSYVMNAYFGYDWSDGSKAIYTPIEGMDSPSKKISSSAIRPDRRLLFAELPIYGSGTPIDEGGTLSGAAYSSSESTETDCVLQYQAYEFNKKWSGKAESIAFNHKYGKKDYCAHVVFTDGHTEKLKKPTGGITKEQLTALLCAGKDIGFDGQSYNWVNSTDKAE